ncbi:MAG: glycosyltransferase family 87 protein [Mariniblastus sp.]
MQEWIGATIFKNGEQDRLYDPAHFKSLQHDIELVEFEWPDKNFFPMVYPPFYYAALQPLASLSYPNAMRVWAVMSAIAFSLTGFLLFKFYQPSRQLLGTWLVASLFFVPLLTCFNMGQKATFLLLILTATFVLLHHKRPFVAGAVFGLIVFKPHLGIVIGLAMLAKGQWRFATGAGVVVGAIVGSSYLMHLHLWSEYLNVVRGMTDYVQSGGYLLEDSHSLWGACQLSLSSWLPANVIKIVVGILSIGICVTLWNILRGKIATDSSRFARQFAVLVLCTILLSPHFYTYDLTIMLLPMILIGASFSDDWRTDKTQKTIALLLVGFFVFASMFGKVAVAIRFQPSILFLVGTIVLVGMWLQESYGIQKRQPPV